MSKRKLRKSKARKKEQEIIKLKTPSKLKWEFIENCKKLKEACDFFENHGAISISRNCVNENIIINLFEKEIDSIFFMDPENWKCEKEMGYKSGYLSEVFEGVKFRYYNNKGVKNHDE